ncbi:MAG: PA0069 family radical SAM protein [Hyphomicrobiales bacterium]
MDDHGVEQESEDWVGVRHDPTALGVVPDQPVIGYKTRGRGAVSNSSGRFETQKREAFDDGWDNEELPVMKTEVNYENPKTIITKNQSPDISFDRSINAYRGCEHGCSYCFARPSHAYLGLSPGVDFETRLFAKPTAAALLEQELAAPNYRPRTIAIGTNTDPYQPIERSHRITREILEVLDRTNHPVGIVTKSHLVTRDIDILSSMAKRGLVRVALSITTLDGKLARAMEPRASTPQKRLDALRQLSDAGVPTSVMVAPIIPALNDSEIETILEKSYEYGARDAGYVLLRLPLEVSEIFKEWLLHHYPNKYRHVLSLLKSMRNGKEYDVAWGRRMRGSGPYADQIAKRMKMAAKRIGMTRRKQALATHLFTPPVKQGSQLSLF